MAKGKRLAPGQPYAGRAPGLIPMNFTMEEEAVRLLREYVPEGKRLGRFVSRLLYEERARREERRRLSGQVRVAVETICGEESVQRKSA